MRSIAIFIAAALVACTGSPHEASCGGAAVGLCRAYEHIHVRTATMTPNELPVADFSMNAHIRVEMDVCPSAPSPIEVSLDALVPGGPDAGTDVRVMSLLMLRDGQPGDTPGDSMIDVDVTNPLIATLPARTDLQLRFTARAGATGCVSDPLEIPYRTGAPRP